MVVPVPYSCDAEHGTEEGQYGTRGAGTYSYRLPAFSVRPRFIPKTLRLTSGVDVVTVAYLHGCSFARRARARQRSTCR